MHIIDRLNYINWKLILSWEWICRNRLYNVIVDNKEKKKEKKKEFCLHIHIYQRIDELDHLTLKIFFKKNSKLSSQSEAVTRKEKGTLIIDSTNYAIDDQLVCTRNHQKP